MRHAKKGKAKSFPARRGGRRAPRSKSVKRPRTSRGGSGEGADGPPQLEKCRTPHLGCGNCYIQPSSVQELLQTAPDDDDDEDDDDDDR